MRLSIRFTLLAAALPLVLAQPRAGSDLFSYLRYRYIGPVGNRVDAAVSIPGDSRVYDVASASGGIFKSTDGGIQWQPIVDHEKVSSVGSLAIAPKDPNIVWAGTNDGLVQITRDGGKNWTTVTANIPGMPEWGTISNIEASRFDAVPNIVTTVAELKP